MSSSNPIPKRSRSRAVASILCALWLGVGAFGSTADPASAEPWGYDLAAELMSPFCPGRTLASCPSPQASELVQWMVMQEAAGVSKEEVIEILIERYGEDILGAPPAKGISVMVYAFPILAFVVGGVLAFVVLSRIVARGGQGGLLPAPATADGSAAAGSAVSGAAPPTPAASTSASSTTAGGTAPSDRDDEDLSRIIDEDLAARA